MSKRFELEIFQRSQKEFCKKLFEDLLKKINEDYLKFFRRKSFNSNILKYFLLKIFPIVSVEIQRRSFEELDLVMIIMKDLREILFFKKISKNIWVLRGMGFNVFLTNVTLHYEWYKYLFNQL
jgi:hypothetical protein